jgi:DNA-binding transcriptional ArsR family regulator
MTGKPQNRQLEFDLYVLLLDGCAQSRAAELLKLSPSTVSYHVGRLLEAGALEVVKGCAREKLYKKGPKATKLDGRLNAVSSKINARGVTHPSNFEQSSTPVKTARVHHGLLRLNVVTEGDVEQILEEISGRSVRRPFLKQYQNRRGLERFKGQLPYKDLFVSVGYERSAKKRTFYIWPPELDLSADELESYEQRWISISVELSNYLQKHAGWKFGIPELTNWQTHIGIEAPALMDGISDKFYMTSEDGQTWTSNSEGRSELETSHTDRARVLLEMPGNVLTLETNLTGLYRVLELLTASLIKTVECTGQLAKVNEITLGKDVLEAVQRLEAQITELRKDQPIPDKVGKKDKEVMYG